MSLAGPKLFKALVAAALEYHAREPWEEIADDETFAMRLEGEPQPVFASVMGQGGLEYGLALFRGDGALGLLRARPDDRERLDAMWSLAVTLQPLRDIPAEFRTALTRAGLERRREDIAPFFISKNPGRRPRDINASEARLLLLALRGILSAFDRGALPVRASAQPSGELLTITVTGDPRSPEVGIGSESFEGAPVTAAPRLIGAPEDLASLPRLEARWLVGFPFSQATIAGDDRSLRILLVVDEGSTKVILARAIHSTEIEEAANAVFEAMDGSNPAGEPGRPREIVTSSRELFDLLAPAVAVADIPCRYAERIEAVESVAADFDEWLRRRGSGADDAPRKEPLLEGHRPADDDLEGWKAADSRVTDWLLDAVSRSGIVTPREAKSFLGSADVIAEHEDPHESAVVESALLEWAAVDVRPTRKGGSLVDRLLRADAPTPEKRAILEGRRLARPGLFRVASRIPGVSLELVDIVAGDSITVHDRSLSRRAEPGEILTLRVMRAGRFHFPVIVGPSIPPAMLADAIAHLRRAGLELTPEGIARDWRLLGRLWAWAKDVNRRSLASPPPRLANTDGESLVWHVASYSVADETAARQALEARPDIERVGERYSWLRRGKGLGGGDLGLGQIEFVGGEIVAQVNSVERHERSRAWLETIPGVKFLGLTRRGLDRPEDLPRDDRRSADEEAAERKTIASLPPEARESLGKILRQHYLDWIDHPLPILGGETPRERCRTEDGRREVAALIRGIPGNPAPGAGTIEPPREEMLRRLGLLSDSAEGD